MTQSNQCWSLDSNPGFLILSLVCVVSAVGKLGESGGKMLCGGGRNPGHLDVSPGSPLRNSASSSGPGLQKSWGSLAGNTSQTFHIQISAASTPRNNSKILAVKLFVLKVINSFFRWHWKCDFQCPFKTWVLGRRLLFLIRRVFMTQPPRESDLNEHLPCVSLYTPVCTRTSLFRGYTRGAPVYTCMYTNKHI